MRALGVPVALVASEPAAWQRRETELFADQALVSETSFLRLLDCSFPAAATALTAWWEHEQRDGFVAVGSKARVGRMRIDHGVGRVRLVIRRRWGPLHSSLPMELELAAWSERRPVTRLELIARSGVRVKWRYFSTGNEVLDAIVAEVSKEVLVEGC
jgi:hypothetical protein